MRPGHLAVVLMGLTQSVVAADCPDPAAVLALMHGADPVLQAEREEYRSIAEKPGWKVEVGAGWTLNGTDYGGELI